MQQATSSLLVEYYLLRELKMSPSGGPALPCLHWISDAFWISIDFLADCRLADIFGPPGKRYFYQARRIFLIR